MRTPRNRNTVADSLALLSTLALAAFVLTMLSLARSVLIPLALAGLLTFLLSPLVTRMERLIGRVAAVGVAVTLIFGVVGLTGWIFTRQVIDLATKLPDYRHNIVGKIHSIELPSGLKAFQHALDEVRREFPAAAQKSEPVVVVPADPPVTGGDGEGSVSVKAEASAPPPGPKETSRPAPAPPVARVEVVTNPSGNPMDVVRSFIGPLMGPLGTAALVMLLAVFMLLQRDDLRRRFIRLVGHGHISSTTQALDDAGQRVSRYLLMQLLINVSYGVPVAIGMYFLGLPNAFLWGGLAAIVRYVPYVGPWIGAAMPTALAFAVSPDWTTPLLTIGFFVVLELISNNVMEPWLYGTSTGVTPIALIVAAVFWTWLWGPVGLVLATPLTVCMVVLGRHVPKLSFLSVLLSDEEALTPAEDFYQRILTPGEHDEMELVETYVSQRSVVELYDDVLIPVVVEAENDVREDTLSREQLSNVHQIVRDVVQDLGGRVESDLRIEPRDADAASPACRVLCIPARAERDELASTMLAHVLQHRGCEAWSVPALGKPGIEELAEFVGKSDLDAVVISIVAPSAVLHARFLCSNLRKRFADLRIIVGLWGMGETMSAATKRLREAGATDVAFSLAEAASSSAGKRTENGRRARKEELAPVELRAARSA